MVLFVVLRVFLCLYRFVVSERPCCDCVGVKGDICDIFSKKNYHLSIPSLLDVARSC